MSEERGDDMERMRRRFGWTVAGAAGMGLVLIGLWQWIVPRGDGPGAETAQTSVPSRTQAAPASGITIAADVLVPGGMGGGIPLTNAALTGGSPATDGAPAPGPMVAGSPVPAPAPLTPQDAGFRIGRFRFFPSLVISEIFDDNIFAARAAPTNFGMARRRKARRE